MEGETEIPRIVFLNDFAACGYGIGLLQKEELYEISNQKVPVKGGPKIIIGAGTGLGEAYIFENDDGDVLVVPGEGGHTDFAPKTKVEFEMMQFIKKKLKSLPNSIDYIII